MKADLAGGQERISLPRIVVTTGFAFNGLRGRV